MADRPGRAAGRTAAVHHRRPDPRTTVVGSRGPLQVPPARRSGRDQAPLRAAPAAPRARARAGSRGRAAQHHPAPARAYQPRHHLDLPPRHRPRGDHHGRSHAPPPDDVRQRWPPALNQPGQRERRRALPLRPGEASAVPAPVQTVAARPQGACATDREHARIDVRGEARVGGRTYPSPFRASTSRYSYGYSAGPPDAPRLECVAKSRKSRSSAAARSGSSARLA